MIDNNTTLVTALYDIGRKDYIAYPRTIETYLQYMDNILSLESNICIFCEEKHENDIKNIRQKYDPNLEYTKIYTIPFDELEFYKLFYKDIEKVMASDFFKQNNQGSIESVYPKYNLINFNKISFVNEILQKNPFNSNYFIWLDAGFWHHLFPKNLRKIIYPNKIKIKKLDDNKVHFLSLCPESNINLQSIFDSRVSIAGSMFAGKAQPLVQFKQEVIQTIKYFIQQGGMNDDQTIYAYIYSKNRDLFTITYGNWFENFYEFC
jgi:protein YibB